MRNISEIGTESGKLAISALKWIDFSARLDALAGFRRSLAPTRNSALLLEWISKQAASLNERGYSGGDRQRSTKV